jgi:hypothetical protein
LGGAVLVSSAPVVSANLYSEDALASMAQNPGLWVEPAASIVNDHSKTTTAAFSQILQGNPMVAEFAGIRLDKYKRPKSEALVTSTKYGFLFTTSVVAMGKTYNLHVRSTK